MDFDVIGYLEEAGISYSYSGKNISQGWIGTSCPFCTDSSNHLGINLDSKVYSCFRCGSKGKMSKLIMELENKTFSQITPILNQFTKKDKNYGTIRIRKNRDKEVDELIYQNSTGLTESHKVYLRSRNFDAEFLESKYKLRSGKPTSLYKHRIIIPYIRQNKTYTFSSRSIIPGQSGPKYLHNSTEQSVFAPKEILFNEDSCKDSCLVLEGVFDVFRIGSGSVALSGIQYTQRQVFLLSRFKRIFILFDPEEQAQIQAIKLSKDLSFCSSSVEIIKVETDLDPGNYLDKDVKYLKRFLFGRNYD